MPRTFQYKALRDPATEIRLLELLPGSGVIRCQLKLFRLDDVSLTVYEPLSYCWGDQKKKVSITLDDADFTVGANLHAALCRLRSRRDAVRTLWVDAVCINQADVPEKNAQIPLMARIYQRGVRTLIWLGEHDHQTSLAFRIIKFLASDAQDDLDAPVDSTAWEEIRRGAEGKHLYRLGALGVWSAMLRREQAAQALSSVFERPWFKRVWIIQEVAVSRDASVICGAYTVDWKDIERTYNITVNRFDNEDYVTRLVEQRQHYQQGMSNSLEAIIWATSLSQATDPRDRIYAMLGLVTPQSEANPIHVTADYSTDVGKVFMETTKNFLQVTGNAGILAASIGCRDHGSYRMPSWVWNPVITNDDSTGINLFAWRPVPIFSIEWKASRSSICTPRFSPDDVNLLGLYGYAVDIVASVGPVRESVATRGIWKSLGTLVRNIYTYIEWRTLAGIENSRAVYPPTSETMSEAFRQTICPHLMGEHEHLDTDTHRELFHKFDRFVAAKFGFLARSPASGMRRQDYVRALAEVNILIFEYLLNAEVVQAVVDFECNATLSENRCLMKTERGYLGLAARHTSVGDSVVLSGSQTPFILRPVGSRWKMVSDCYIHGIMNGEIWDETKCRPLWVE
jgi:hypothetical protein